MMEFLIFVAVAFSLPALVLGLLQLVAPQSSLHEGVRRRLAQFKLWQLVVADPVWPPLLAEDDQRGFAHCAFLGARAAGRRLALPVLLPGPLARARAIARFRSGRGAGATVPSVLSSVTRAQFKA